MTTAVNGTFKICDEAWLMEKRKKKIGVNTSTSILISFLLLGGKS